jgi:quinol monooxygenase YgiN
MIKRIVKLTFEPDKTDDFLAIFKESKAQIRAFPGCQHLELWRDQKAPGVFFTYSFWVDEAALEQYRHSTLFRTTWEKTKALFAERPAAWSVRLVEEV